VGSSEVPDFGPAWAAAHAKAKAKVRPSFTSSAFCRVIRWTMFDMVSLTDTGPMLDKARKFKSLIVLIDDEQHIALSMHFDALSARFARRYSYFDEDLTAFKNQAIGYIFITYFLDRVYVPCVPLANYISSDSWFDIG
jgi:hypothetical protein